MGSDESRFNVSLIVMNKVTRQSPQTTTFEEKRDPKRIRTEVPSAYHPNALPLGQTGSHTNENTKLPLNAVTRCMVAWDFFSATVSSLLCITASTLQNWSHILQGPGMAARITG